MSSSATSRRMSAATDDPALLNSNRPQLQIAPAPKRAAAPFGLSTPLATAPHAHAPARSATAASRSTSVRNLTRTSIPARRGSANASTASGTRGNNNSNASVSSNATSLTATTPKLSETPRAASTAHSSTTSTPASYRPQVTAGHTKGPRFTQPTISSRAHLPKLDSRGNLDEAALQANSSSSTTTTAATAEHVPPARSASQTRRPPSARESSHATSTSGDNANSGEAGSHSRLAQGSAIRRGSASPIEPGAAQSKHAKAGTGPDHSSYSTSTPAGVAGKAKGETAGNTRSGNASVTEGTEAPRRRVATHALSNGAASAAAAASMTTATTHRTADPAPTIGQVRRKAPLPIEVSKSDLRDPLQTSPSSSRQPSSSSQQQQQQQQHSALATPLSTPMLTPAENLSVSVPSLLPSSVPPSVPVDVHAARKAPKASGTSHSTPRPPVTATRGLGTPATSSPRDLDVSPAKHQTSTAEMSSGPSTPVRSPNVSRSTAGRKAEVASPPLPSRPTAAPHDTAPLVWQIPVLEARGSQTMSTSSAPRSPSASAANAQAARRNASEDTAGRHSTSPHTPPRSLSSKRSQELAKSAHNVTHLSTSDLGSAEKPRASSTATAESRPSTGTPKETRRRSSSRPAVAMPHGIALPTSSEITGVGLSPTHHATLVEADVDSNSAGQSVPAQSAPTPRVRHRSSSASSTRGARSVGDRSHSPPAESIAALLEDLQVLRQREAEESQRVEAMDQQRSQKDAEAEAQRSHRKAIAAVNKRRSVDRDGAAADHAAEGSDGDEEEAKEANKGTFLFPAEESANDAEVDGRPSRATDTTGHAPVTPRLRRRIQQEQQRELDLLRTITRERHPENVELLDSPDELIRELGCLDADMDPAEVEEALRSLSAEDVAALDESSLPVVRATEEVAPTPRAPSTTAAKPLRRSEAADGAAMRGTTRKPPLREDASSEQRHGSAEPEPTPNAHSASARTRESSRSQRVSSTAGSEASVGKKTDTSVPSPQSSTATTRAALRPPSSRGRSTLATEAAMGNSNNSNNSQSTGAKFVRRPSKAAVTNDMPSPAAVGGAHQARDALKTSSAAADGAERRRRTLAESAMGGPVSTPTSAADHYTRLLPRHGSQTNHSVDASPTSDKAAVEHLLPALISPEEAERTITIVFDLDETLCNNRCLGGALLRPGAELLLHTLRSLAPSPRYKLVDTRTRGQHATARLYDQAMFKMGMAPLYRPRVAQRQATSGYHANIVGGSTGEARPATTKETHALRIELVLWTASEESLARRAMRRLDPQSAIFDEAIYRDVRWYRDSYYTKELSRLGRSMQRVVIIENSVESVIRNRQNAILVTSFITNRLDRQLFLVREVLRDWTRGMKANLAYHLEQHAAKQAGDAAAVTESAEHAVSQRDDNDALRDSSNSVPEESQEEGGESPVPPHSTSSPSREDRVGSAATAEEEEEVEDEEPVPHSTTPAPMPKGVATHPLVVGNSALGASTDSAGSSAPRVLSAAAQRAGNIVQFLHRHRLILSESNYINFQMTGEVMLRLQSTETALISAALPPAAEAPATRTVRSSGCGPAPRTPRSARVPPSPAGPASAPAAGPTHGSAVPVSTTNGSNTGGPQGGGRTTGGAGVTAVSARTPTHTHSGPHTQTAVVAAAAAAASKTTAVTKSEPASEIKRELNSLSSSPASSAALPLAKTSAVRAARDSRQAPAILDTVNGSGGISSNGSGGGVSAERPAARPVRTASSAAKRPTS